VCIGNLYGVHRLLKAAGNRLTHYWGGNEGGRCAVRGERRDYRKGRWAARGERCTECPRVLDEGPTACRRASHGWGKFVCTGPDNEEVREYLCSECRAPRACQLCHDWGRRVCLRFDRISGATAADAKPCAACGDLVCRECALCCRYCERHWCASKGKDCYGPRKGYKCKSCDVTGVGNPEGVGSGLRHWACDWCPQMGGLKCVVCDKLFFDWEGDVGVRSAAKFNPATVCGIQ
jgi:hypothetical protein